MSNNFHVLRQNKTVQSISSLRNPQYQNFDTGPTYMQIAWPIMSVPGHYGKEEELKFNWLLIESSDLIDWENMPANPSDLYL